MSCAPLSAINWGWCFLLGAFEIVWGQIVAFVPTKRLPKQMTVSRKIKSLKLHLFLHFINFRHPNHSLSIRLATVKCEVKCRKFVIFI